MRRTWIRPLPLAAIGFSLALTRAVAAVEIEPCRIPAQAACVYGGNLGW